MCEYRWKICLLVLSSFATVWGYDPCPLTVRMSPEAKAPSITEHDIELAFHVGELSVQRQKQMSKTERVFPKGLKTAETVHPQANQKPVIPQMEARQRIFEEASRFLTTSYDLSPIRQACGLPQIHPIGEAAAKALEACVSKENIVCNRTDKYRTADGSCNNLKHPTWGRAFSPVIRYLPPSHTDEDGLRKPVGCEQLPNPRLVSELLHSTTGKRTSKANHLYVFFGQFLSHDITFTAQSTTEKNEAIQCCSPREDNHHQCAPINATSFPIYPNTTCINFVRSALYPSCTLGHRAQINTVTSFIDGSQIYGSSEDEMKSLRALDGTGKLLVQNSQFGPLLPKSTDPNNDRCSVPQNNQICFRAGDQRANQNPVLVSLHTIFVREHNRVATELKALNPHWKEEKLFQEARRIVIGQIQNILMKEYLPLTVGDILKMYFPDGVTAYSNNTDPSISTEFSTAAFRFGHSMIDTTVAEMPRRPGHNGHLLRDRFFEPFGLYEGEVDLLMMGASKTPAQALDRALVKDVTNYLYRTRGQPAGLDLAAMNIQRGRDHALPSYVDLYNACHPEGPDIVSFYDLEEQHVMTSETIQALRSVYRNVRNIDAWTGIISEMPKHGGILGPTGSCIVLGQFIHLVLGDRYWYTHTDQAGSFTDYQLSTLQWSTLGGIICINTNATEIPWRAMELPGKSNYMQSCQPYSGINLYAWVEY